MHTTHPLTQNGSAPCAGTGRRSFGISAILRDICINNLWLDFTILSSCLMRLLLHIRTRNFERITTCLPANLASTARTSLTHRRCPFHHLTHSISLPNYLSTSSSASAARRSSTTRPPPRQAPAEMGSASRCSSSTADGTEPAVVFCTVKSRSKTTMSSSSSLLNSTPKLMQAAFRIPAENPDHHA